MAYVRYSLTSHGRGNPKLISMRGTVKKRINDFDFVTVDARKTCVRNLTQEDVSMEKHRKESIFSGHLNNAESFIPVPPSDSAEISSNKLPITEMMGAICTQNDENNIQHARMRAKAFIDQMLSDRKFIVKQGSSSEHKPFSYALEFLSTNKDLFMEFFPGPNPRTARFINPVLNDKLSECESEGATVLGQGSTDNHYLKNINHKCQYSSETSFKAHPDKIVILKPASLDIKYSDNVTCHGSSLPAYKKLRGKMLKSKPASFSLKEMKRKLKNAFAGNRKEPNQFFMDGCSHKLATSRSIFKVGDYICRESDTKDSFSSSKNVEIKENLCKKPCLKSTKGPDIVCMSNTVRKKIDFPSVSLSRKQEFDVIFEPRRHLSTRVKNITEIEIPMRKNSPKALEQIFSSPDHDLLPINPRKNGQSCPGSAQMRFCPFSNSLTRSPLRPNKEVTSSDDFEIYDGIEILEMKTSSYWIRSTVDQAHDTITAATDDMNCRPMIEEMSCIQQTELSYSELNEINSGDVVKTRKRIDRIKDSLSENETLVPTVDDVPSTPSFIYRLNMSDHTKYHEEHQSPISVLEPFSADDSISPQSILLQTAEQESVQPLRLDFEECSSDSILQNPQTNANSSMGEKNYISRYVHLVMQVSCLNWDHLSAMTPPHQELLDPSLFNEVEFLPVDSHTDPKLLFDHINEVVLQMYQCHFRFPLRMAFIKPKMLHLPLVEAVLYEIMREADFYLLPHTEKRTLNQKISKDVADSRSWLDIRLDTEQIVNDVSEEVLGESVLDMILEFLN